MIQLYELIEQKRMLDTKISEVEGMLSREYTEYLAKEYIDMIDERQGMLININNANNKSTISISEKDVPVSVALIIRESILDKINIITSIINKSGCDDIIGLQKQRDKFNDNYTLLDMAITNNDIGVSIG